MANGSPETPDAKSITIVLDERVDSACANVARIFQAVPSEAARQAFQSAGLLELDLSHYNRALLGLVFVADARAKLEPAQADEAREWLSVAPLGFKRVTHSSEGQIPDYSYASVFSGTTERSLDMQRRIYEAMCERRPECLLLPRARYAAQVAFGEIGLKDS